MKGDLQHPPLDLTDSHQFDPNYTRAWQCFERTIECLVKFELEHALNINFDTGSTAG